MSNIFPAGFHPNDTVAAQHRKAFMGRVMRKLGIRLPGHFSACRVEVLPASEAHESFAPAWTLEFDVYHSRFTNGVTWGGMTALPGDPSDMSGPEFLAVADRNVERILETLEIEFEPWVLVGWPDPTGQPVFIAPASDEWAPHKPTQDLAGAKCLATLEEARETLDSLGLTGLYHIEPFGAFVPEANTEGEEVETEGIGRHGLPSQFFPAND